MIDIDNSFLLAALSENLEPKKVAQGREISLRSRLAARVRQSVLTHKEYLTVRREEGEWRQLSGGVRARRLRADESTSVEIVQLQEGAELPWPEGVFAQEILVLTGIFFSSGSSENQQFAYQVRYRQTPLASLIAATEVTLYVRQLHVVPEQLPELEARWWSFTSQASSWTLPSRKHWVETSVGVKVLALRGDRDVVSMLVRFAPGASVSDHAHALNEDCLVLEGEMFLGDILLRKGDYHLAPAGGSHFGETSDVGAVFFFHGALDPVLKAKH